MRGGFYLLAVMSIGGGATVVGPRVQAAEAVIRPLSAKRQLINCMTREMSANKSLSYIDATKSCKTQLKREPPALASSARVKQDLSR